MRRPYERVRRFVVLGTLAVAAPAAALPVELRDSNGTRYFVNTQVDPFEDVSNASGALTNATYVKAVTVTSTFVGFTPFFFFLTYYTVQRQVNVPLRNAFGGFNGLAITQLNDQSLSPPLVFNPRDALAAEDCPQDGKNRQLIFPTQVFPGAPQLQVTRKVLVSHNSEFVRWLNVVTNTGPDAVQVGVTLRGLLGSGSDTRIIATSTGSSTLGAGVTWFTATQEVPEGFLNDQPRNGFVVQGEGAVVPASSLGINSGGQTAFTYRPTIAAGASAIIMTFVTVQGKAKQAKNTVADLVTLPSSTIKCMSQQELREVVNFAPITPPDIKNATIKLKFKKTGADTIAYKGKVNVGQGVPIENLPVTVDVGGVRQTFVLNKKGVGKNGGGNKFKLDAKLKQGVTKNAQNAKFSFQFKGDFKAQLAGFGLTDAAAKNVPVTVPISFSVARTYAVDQPFSYDAKAGKSGTAKSS
jgi:hypothetical protein